MCTWVMLDAIHGTIVPMEGTPGSRTALGTRTVDNEWGNFRAERSLLSHVGICSRSVLPQCVTFVPVKCTQEESV